MDWSTTLEQTDDQRIEIYKRWLSEKKNDPTRSKEWKDNFVKISKIIFSDEIREIKKYHACMIIAAFDSIKLDDGIYYASTARESQRLMIETMNSKFKKYGIKFIFVKKG